MLYSHNVTYWSQVLNVIIQNYLLDATTVCIIWHSDFDIELNTSSSSSGDKQFIQIRPDVLETSFLQNVYDFESKAAELSANGVYYDDFVLKFIVSIEQSHCEAFIAFQNDIPKLAQLFTNASILAEWRSQRNRFIFAYHKDVPHKTDFYFQTRLFSDQPNILVIEAETLNSRVFQLKTNTFVGPFETQRGQLQLLISYDAVTLDTKLNAAIFFDKIKDLKGRSVIVGAFDYRPFVVVDDNLQPQIRDYGSVNQSGTLHVDGTEIRVLYTYCERRNCTVAFDSSEKEDWGFIYPNCSSDGLLGMVMERRIDMSVGAFYPFISYYADFTTFLGRSGVTCMVPAATRVTSWNLPLRPFQPSLWLCLVVALLVEIIALLITRQLDRQRRFGSSVEWIESFHFGFTTTLKLLVSQSTSYVIKAASVRMLLGACYLVDLIVTSIYGGGLAAILTLPTMAEVPDSVARMLKYNLQWIGQSMDWIEPVLDDDSVDFKKILSNYRATSVEAMVEDAAKDYKGFIIERLTFGHFGNVEYLTPAALNRLKLMVDDIYFQYTVGYVPRCWALTANYNDFILWWHSAGLDKYWEWKITANFMDENQQGHIEASMHPILDHGPVKLDMVNFSGFIVIWLIGISLSCSVFGLELLVRHTRRS